METMTVTEKITAAKLVLQSKATFFYTLCTFLNIKRNDSIGTAGVDIKRNMYYNEAFIEPLTIYQIAGLIAHETLHDAFMHLVRSSGLNHNIMNIAADLKVNQLVLEMNMDLPEGGYIPNNNAFTFKGLNYTLTEIDKKSVEQIYNEIYPLIKDKESQQQGSAEGGSGEGKGTETGKDGDEYSRNYGFGEGIDVHITEDISKLSDAEIDDMARRRRSDVSMAQQMAQRSQGNLPASFNGMIDALLNPKVDWRTVLANYITNHLPNDYTWSRPARKSLSTGIYLPSALKENLEVVVAIDTSGSIQDKELESFLGECISMVNSFDNLKMTLLFADTQVHDHYEIDNSSNSEDQLYKIKLTGGRGGTSHIGVNDWVIENKPGARVVVAFTDGYSSFPDINDVRCDWIWVIVPSGCEPDHIPFGKVTKMQN